MKFSYDSDCLRLADHFLAEFPEDRRERHREKLAQAIQHAVEDYINYEIDAPA